MEPVNKYEVVYGQMFTSRRVVWATSKNKVVEHCEVRYPEIFPIREINLLEEDVNRKDIGGKHGIQKI